MGSGCPDPVGAGYRIWKMGDRGTVGLLYPISHLRSSAAKAALADGFREVGDFPDFSVHYGSAID